MPTQPNTQDQLKLPLTLPRAARPVATDFIPAASNEAALTWLDRTADWPQGRLALWGETGRGKTHLLHRWAGATGAQYLTGPTLPRLDELPDLPSVAGLAVDDADAVADEATLLHLLNAAAEARLPVLLAACTPPARWPVRLRDLASRLRAMTAVELLPPDDDLLRVLLARLFDDRQHHVSQETQAWLLTRLPRTPAALREAVDRLNHAALGSSRGITRLLARDELADLIGADRDAPDPEEADPDEADPGDGRPTSHVTPRTATRFPETTMSSARPSPPGLRLL